MTCVSPRAWTAWRGREGDQKKAKQQRACSPKGGYVCVARVLKIEQGKVLEANQILADALKLAKEVWVFELFGLT